MNQDAARAFIAGSHSGVLATIKRDGRPQMSNMVYLLDDDGRIKMSTRAPNVKVRNIRRDPRVSLSIEAPSGDQWGMKHYLVVEGRARIIEGGAPKLLHDLAQRYIGPGAQFPPMPDLPEGFIIRVTPEKIRGMGPWGTMLS